MNESFQFRHAAPNEIDAIALVLARANAKRDDQPLPDDVEEDRVSDLQERMSRDHAWTYVAVSNNEEVVGFALGYPRTGENTPAETADTEYLSLLMVEPNAWGKGIASRLLDIVADRARSAGRSRLTLWTRGRDNKHARTVYEHKGFKLTPFARESEHGPQVEYVLPL